MRLNDETSSNRSQPDGSVTRAYDDSVKRFAHVRHNYYTIVNFVALQLRHNSANQCDTTQVLCNTYNL